MWRALRPTWSARDLLYFHHYLKPQRRAQPPDRRALSYPLAGLIALVVLLVACLLWWRGGGLGGILFDPDATVTRMPQHAGLRWSAWAVFAATTLLSAWVWLHALPSWAKAGGVIVVVAIAMLGCVLLRQILRWMGSGMQRTQMLPAMAGCALPWLVCLLAAVVALKGQVALLRTGATDPAGMAQLATCILLLMLGALWWSVCAVQAVAAAGGCARTRAFGAWALTVAALGILIAVLRVPVAVVAFA